jgi:hypothetical protein
MEKCTYVDVYENDAVWGTTLCPPGLLTDLHYDHHGSMQLMVGISTRKLWLIWSPTSKNLEWWSGFPARTPTGRETIEAVNTMEGFSILYQQGLNAFTLPPYHLHAILTFDTSTHCRMTF